MNTIYRLISVWVLILVGSLFLPLVSVVAASSTTYETSYASTTTPATDVEHLAAIDTGNGSDTSLQSIASSQACCFLDFGRNFNAPKNVGTLRQPIYSAKVLDDMAADKFHNFPASFEKSILSKKPLVRPDGRMEFLQRGTINGTDGVFHITTRNSGKVMSHRTFIPESDWGRFSTRWELPGLDGIAR